MHITEFLTDVLALAKQKYGLDNVEYLTQVLIESGDIQIDLGVDNAALVLAKALDKA